MMEEISAGGSEGHTCHDPPGRGARLIVAEDDSKGVGQRGPEHGLALWPEGEGGWAGWGLRASAFGLRLSHFHRVSRSAEQTGLRHKANLSR
jgi:hypothetical protein